MASGTSKITELKLIGVSRVSLEELRDQQLRALEMESLKEGGFTQKLYRARSEMRNERRKT